MRFLSDTYLVVHAATHARTHPQPFCPASSEQPAASISKAMHPCLTAIYASSNAGGPIDRVCVRPLWCHDSSIDHFAGLWCRTLLWIAALSAYP
jgi:hypothetical protein